MGPGRIEPKSPADYWEFFVDPVDFKILAGKVEGNTISFEHEAGKSIPATGGLAANIGPAGLVRPLPSKSVYRGTIEGNRIVMTRETVSQDSDPWVLGKHKVQFILERVK